MTSIRSIVACAIHASSRSCRRRAGCALPFILPSHLRHNRLASVLLALAVATAAPAATYYVKADGNNLAAGTSDATAWATIAKVNSFSFSTGDDVYFKCGATFTGAELTVDWTGSSGNRVVVGAYYMNAGIETVGVSGVRPIINGQNTHPADSGKGLAHITKPYVTLQDLDVRNSAGRGVRAQDTADNTLVRNVVINHCYAQGVQFHQVDNCIVEYSDISDVNNKGDGAIVVSQQSNNTIVRHNKLHDSAGWSEGVNALKSDNMQIIGNLIYNTRAMGVYFDHAKGSVCMYNLIYYSADTTYWRIKNAQGVTVKPSSGFRLANENAQDSGWENHRNQDITIAYNVVAGAGTGLSVGQNSISGLVNCTIVGNTFVQMQSTDGSHIGIEMDNTATGSIFKNNIVWMTDGTIVGAIPASGIGFDYNLWSSEPEDADAKGTNDPIYGPPLIAKTSGWASLTAGELDGSEFLLQSGSPAIDAGVSLSGFADALHSNARWPVATAIPTADQGSFGTGPEIGAFVRTGSAPAAPSNLTATAVSSSEINLGWTDNASNEAQFRIESKTGVGSFTWLTNKGANSISHNNTGLLADTAYTYRVRAENSDGNSGWSNEAGATTSAGGGSPTTVQFESATVAANTDPYQVRSSPGDVFFEANADGDYITFSVPNIAAGTYAIDVTVQKGPNRGIFQLESSMSLGGAYTTHGSPQDTYYSGSYPTETLPIASAVTFASTGTRYFRFRITGKNPASNNRRIAVDAMVLTPVSGAPEIDVTGNGASIPDGDTTPGTSDHTDFGGTNVAAGTVDRIFTIHNTGTTALTVGTVTVSGTHAADFTVTAQAAASVETGGSTTFTVRFDPSANGVRTAGLSFSNDDTDEDPYNFSIEGTGSSPMSVQFESATVAANTDSYQVRSSTGDVFFEANADGDYITFSIPNVGAGTYAISVTVQKGPNRGIFQLESSASLGGAYTAHGSPQDTYYSGSYPTETLAVASAVTFSGTSTRYFRFRITGKNPASNNRRIAVDEMTLTP